MKIVAYVLITAFFALQLISGIRNNNKDIYKKIEIVGASLAVIGGLVIIALETTG